MSPDGVDIALIWLGRWIASDLDCESDAQPHAAPKSVIFALLAAGAATMSGMHTPPPCVDTGSSWAETLLQGSLAALIGGGALLFVWWLTQRADRRKTIEQRTSDSVAKILEAADALPVGKVTMPGELRVEAAGAAVRISRALQVFGAREIRDHENASLWAFDWARTIARLGDAVANAGSAPALTATTERLVAATAEVNSSLVMWLSLGDSFLLSKPDEAGFGLEDAEDDAPSE